MLHDNLKLNDEKTELLIIGTLQQLEKVVVTHIREGNTSIHPVPVARNLFRKFAAHHSAIWITYVGSESISLTSQQSHLLMLWYQFVLTKVTVYCMVCQTAHWSNYNVCRMPVLDWYLLRVDCRITPLLIKLHWLPIHSRIVFKILLLTFKILHGTTHLELLISLKPQSCYNLRRS